MNSKHIHDLVKMHCLHSLFEFSGEKDGYLADKIKAAIEFSLTGSEEIPASLEGFVELAHQLCADIKSMPPSYVLHHIELSNRTWDPLWLHGEFMQALRRISGHDTAVLVVSGLRQAICPRGRYWTRRMQKQHKEAVDYMDDLAMRWVTPSTNLTLLYL